MDWKLRGRNERHTWHTTLHAAAAAAAALHHGASKWNQCSRKSLLPGNWLQIQLFRFADAQNRIARQYLPPPPPSLSYVEPARIRRRRGGHLLRNGKCATINTRSLGCCSKLPFSLLFSYFSKNRFGSYLEEYIRLLLLLLPPAGSNTHTVCNCCVYY